MLGKRKNDPKIDIQDEMWAKSKAANAECRRQFRTRPVRIGTRGTEEDQEKGGERRKTAAHSTSAADVDCNVEHSQYPSNHDRLITLKSFSLLHGEIHSIQSSRPSH